MYMMYLLKIDTVVSAINVNTKVWGCSIASRLV